MDFSFDIVVVERETISLSPLNVSGLRINANTSPLLSGSTSSPLEQGHLLSNDLVADGGSDASWGRHGPIRISALWNVDEGTPLVLIRPRWSSHPPPS